MLRQAASAGGPAIANEKEESNLTPHTVTVTVNMVVTTKMMTVAQAKWRTAEEEDQRVQLWQQGECLCRAGHPIRKKSLLPYLFFLLKSVIRRITLFKKNMLKIQVRFIECFCH